MSPRIKTKPKAAVADVNRIAAAIGMAKMGRTIARRLVRHGITSVAKLRRPAVLATLPRAARANVLYGTGRTRAPLAVAAAAVEELGRRLELDGKKYPTVVVGSVRRKVPTIKDLDLLVVVPTKTTEEAMKTLLRGVRLRATTSPSVTIMDIYARGSRRAGLVVSYAAGGVRRYFHADIFLTTVAEKPFALFHYTGDARYNIRTRALVKKNGHRLNQYGLFDIRTKQRVAGSEHIRTEKALAKMIGVSYRLPENRNSFTVRNS